MTNPLEPRLRALLAELVEVPGDADAPLGLPSLDLIVLAENLEATWKIQVLASEMTPENFGTLNGLLAYLKGKGL